MGIFDQYRNLISHTPSLICHSICDPDFVRIYISYRKHRRNLIRDLLQCRQQLPILTLSLFGFKSKLAIMTRAQETVAIGAVLLAVCCFHSVAATLSPEIPLHFSLANESAKEITNFSQPREEFRYRKNADQVI